MGEQYVARLCMKGIEYIHIYKRGIIGWMKESKRSEQVYFTYPITPVVNKLLN
jgi:hypothetical protein